MDISPLHSRDHRDGIVQNRYGMRMRPKKVDNQLSDMLNTDDRGSNLENRLVIIFSSVLLCGKLCSILGLGRGF